MSSSSSGQLGDDGRDGDLGGRAEVNWPVAAAATEVFPCSIYLKFKISLNESKKGLNYKFSQKNRRNSTTSMNLPEEILWTEQTNDRPKRLWGNYFVRRGEICGTSPHKTQRTVPEWRAIESPFYRYLINP